MSLEALATLAMGGLFITLFCWRDLKEKMARKTNNHILRGLVYLIFLILSLSLYLAICYWFVPGLFSRGKVDVATFSKALGIAVLTFGAGSTTYFDKTNLKFSPYKLLLDLLMSTIPDPTPADDLGKLRKEVRLRKCEKLIEGAKGLRQQASDDERWDPLSQKWTYLGIDYLWCEISDLSTYDKEMEQPEIALHDIRHRETELEDELIEKLDDYISSFYVTNGLTREDRQKIVDTLDMPSLVMPIEDIHSQLASRLFQNGMIGFILGAVNGLILASSPKISVDWGGLSFVSGIAFASFCALISYSECSLGGWKMVAGLGTIAGIVSSLIFFLGILILNGASISGGILNRILSYMAGGGMFGAIVSLIAFYASGSLWLNKERWLRYTWQRIIFFGSLAGFGVALLFLAIGKPSTLDFFRLLRGFLLGFVATSGLVLTMKDEAARSRQSGNGRAPLGSAKRHA